ncbi:hypothetical protein ALC53_08559, partial [Atta colombica]
RKRAAREEDQPSGAKSPSSSLKNEICYLRVAFSFLKKSNIPWQCNKVIKWYEKERRDSTYFCVDSDSRCWLTHCCNKSFALTIGQERSEITGLYGISRIANDNYRMLLRGSKLLSTTRVVRHKTNGKFSTHTETEKKRKIHEKYEFVKNKRISSLMARDGMKSARKHGLSSKRKSTMGQ